MRKNIDEVRKLILNSEGGFAIRPTEPGGAVNMGLSHATFSDWWTRIAKKRGAPTHDDLKKLSKSEVLAIYDVMTLKPIRFDELPDGVDYCVLDFAVNSGNTGAMRVIQKALGFDPTTKDDDPQFWWALKNRDKREVILAICDARLEFCKNLPAWTQLLRVDNNKTWGDVWRLRINNVRRHALHMAAGPMHAKGSKADDAV